MNLAKSAIKHTLDLSDTWVEPVSELAQTEWTWIPTCVDKRVYSPTAQLISITHNPTIIAEIAKTATSGYLADVITARLRMLVD
jgi:hypothetical protein